MAIEVLHVHRVEPDPPVRRGLDARPAASASPRRRSASRSSEGLPVMYVTEDTTRADPDTLRALYSTAIRAGAQRGSASPTRSATRRRTGAAAVVEVRAVGRGRVRRRRRHRLARPPRSRPGGRQQRWRRSTPARRVCTARRSASASGSATRRWTLLLVNLVLMGYIERDLSRACASTARLVSEATGVPIPANYPVVGRDAFRTATGVHAAAVIKAFKKNDAGAGRRRLLRRAGQPGRPRAGRSRSGRCRASRTSSSGSSGAAIAATDELVDRIFAKAKASSTVLTSHEIAALITGS